MSEVLDTPEVQKIYIDARGPRFAATITATVLAIALVTQNKWVLFKNVVKPRLSKVAPTEDVRPPKFAQAVGFIFALVGTIGAFAGADLVFTIATGFALAAAFLNSAFNYCLGCEMYLLIVRFTSK